VQAHGPEEEAPLHDASAAAASRVVVGKEPARSDQDVVAEVATPLVVVLAAVDVVAVHLLVPETVPAVLVAEMRAHRQRHHPIGGESVPLVHVVVGLAAAVELVVHRQAVAAAQVQRLEPRQLAAVFHAVRPPLARQNHFSLARVPAALLWRGLVPPVLLTELLALLETRHPAVLVLLQKATAPGWGPSQKQKAVVEAGADSQEIALEV
jgi:hypothetical protein